MINPLVLRILRWRVRVAESLRPGELQVTLFWAGVAGFLGALISYVFRMLAQGLHFALTLRVESVIHSMGNLPMWERILIPAWGGLTAGAIIQFGTRALKGQSSTDYMEAISLKDGVIRVRSTLVKSCSSLITIASGGSIGREGPMVQLSAMLASLVGRGVRLSTPRLQLLVACGAAAGIASAYNAPIAGALFVGEIVLGSIAMESFGPLIFASVISTVTTRQLLGASPVFTEAYFHLISNWELVFYLCLGLIAGLLAPRFLAVLEWSEKLFSKLPSPLSIRLALGGLAVGFIALLRPDEIMGNGYTVIDLVLNQKQLSRELGILLVLKLMATAATVGSGAVGGVFTPTLVMGALLGCLFGNVMQLPWIGHDWVAPSSAYALVGMGCFLAGTTHAPVMAILMIFEMTRDYAIVPPLMLACVTAHYTAQGIRPGSIYSAVLLRKKRDTDAGRGVPNRTVRELMKPRPLSVGETARFDEIANTFASNRNAYLYVTSKEDQLRGAISLHDIKTYLNEPGLATLVIASDFLREDFPFLTVTDTFSAALEAFSRHDGERLPVVDGRESRKLVGAVSKTDLLLTLAHGEQAPRAAGNGEKTDVSPSSTGRRST
jgi:CIC family chloride channel protein